MKKTIKFFVLASFMFAFSVNMFAQVSATASAAATIVTPIAIVKATDMNFGNVAASAALGTVVLAPAGGRIAGGGVTLPTVIGTVTAASFNVSGQANLTYSITLPAGATTIASGANTMTVDTWLSTPTVALGGTLSALGAQTLLVGATLHVAASQAAGSYSSSNAGGSGNFTVTVNYN
jgi:hypothetical protein